MKSRCNHLSINKLRGIDYLRFLIMLSIIFIKRKGSIILFYKKRSVLYLKSQKSRIFSLTKYLRLRILMARLLGLSPSPLRKSKMVKMILSVIYRINCNKLEGHILIWLKLMKPNQLNLLYPLNNLDLIHLYLQMFNDFVKIRQIFDNFVKNKTILNYFLFLKIKALNNEQLIHYY